ncbi:uncharacterized protein LOC128883328 [Hylaeus volcanicus]|uniref:uncharacterized protein LOC128883328 n=1 Tax=Hylaeus volcanicus TaxID=313075 RepID=UPI0023B848C6|nr:uncharacterized protein LOC128883328 [Hylaeus volcanicus]
MDYLTKIITNEQGAKEDPFIDIKLATCSGALHPFCQSSEKSKFVSLNDEESNPLSSEHMKLSPIASFDFESILLKKKSKSTSQSFIHPTIYGSTYVTSPFMRTETPMSPFQTSYKELNLNDYCFFDVKNPSESFRKDPTITIPCLVDVSHVNTLKDSQSNGIVTLLTPERHRTMRGTTCTKEEHGLAKCIEGNPKALIPFTVRPRIWNKNHMDASVDPPSLSHYEKISPFPTNFWLPSDMTTNTPPLTLYSTNMEANWIMSSKKKNWCGSTCQFESESFQSPQKQCQQDKSSATEHLKKKEVFIKNPSLENNIPTKLNSFSDQTNFQTFHEKKNLANLQPFNFWCNTQEESHVNFNCITPKNSQHVLNQLNKSRTQSPLCGISSFKRGSNETPWKTSTNPEHPHTHFETSPVAEEILKEEPNEIKDFSGTYPESNASFPKLNSPRTPGETLFNDITKPTHTLNTPSNKSLMKKGFQWDEPSFTPTSPLTQLTNNECHTQNVIHPTLTSSVPMETSSQIESHVTPGPTVPLQEAAYKLQKSSKESLNVSNTFQKTFQYDVFSPNRTNTNTCFSKSKKKNKKKMKPNVMESVLHSESQQASHARCQSASGCHFQNSMLAQVSHESLPYAMAECYGETMPCNASASSSGEYLSTEAFQYKMLHSCQPDDGPLFNSYVGDHLSPRINILKQLTGHDVPSTIHKSEKYDGVEAQNLQISLLFPPQSPQCSHVTPRCVKKESSKSNEVDFKNVSSDETVVEEYDHQRNVTGQLKEPFIPSSTLLKAPSLSHDFLSQSFSSFNESSLQHTLASTLHTCHPTQPITRCANNRSFPQLPSTDASSQKILNGHFPKSYICEPLDPQMCNGPYYNKQEKSNMARKPYCIIPEQHTIHSTNMAPMENAATLVSPMEVSGISPTASIPKDRVPVDTTSQFLKDWMDPTRPSYGSTKPFEDSSEMRSSFQRTKKFIQPAYFPTASSLLYKPCLSEDLLQKFQTITHLEPEYKKFLKNIPRKSKEAFTPSDFAAFRTCHPHYSKNCFILMQNGYDIRLGEIGRAALKKEISRRLKNDSKLREKCVSVVCRLKNANVLQLLQMAEISGCLALGLKISSMYWKEYSRKQRPSMSIKEYTELCTTDSGHLYNEQIHWNAPADERDRQVNDNTMYGHYTPLSSRLKESSCYSMKRYLDYNHPNFSSPLKRHEAFLMDTTNYASLKDNNYVLDHYLSGNFKTHTLHLPEKQVILDSSKNDTTSCCFPILPTPCKKFYYDTLSSGTTFLSPDGYQPLSHSTPAGQEAALFEKDFISSLSYPTHHFIDKCYEGNQSLIFGTCDDENTSNNDLQNISSQSKAQFCTKPEYYLTEESSYQQEKYLKTENYLNTMSWETCKKSTCDEANTYFSLRHPSCYDGDQPTLFSNEGSTLKNSSPTDTLEGYSFNLNMLSFSSADVRPPDLTTQSNVDTDNICVKKRRRASLNDHVDTIVTSKQNNYFKQGRSFQKRHCDSMVLHDMSGETTLLMTPYRTHVAMVDDNSQIFENRYTIPPKNSQGMCSLESDSVSQQTPRLNGSTSVSGTSVERFPESSNHTNDAHRSSTGGVPDDSNHSTHNSTSEHDTKSTKDSPGLSMENSPNVLDFQITDSKESLSSKPLALLSRMMLPSNKQEPSIVCQNNAQSFTNLSNSTTRTFEKHTQQYSSLMSSSRQTSTLLSSQDTPCEMTPEYFLSSPVPSVS